MFTPDGSVGNAPYHLVNASLTWKPERSHYYVQLFVKNMTNSYYFVSGVAGVGGNQLYASGAPRTYGAELGVHF